tara:strand:+ start:305 stop:595 length:291 start_codon:yes stop_codon:yes gene_type:complete
MVDQGGLRHVVEPTGVSGELCLQGGLIDDGVWINGINGGPEGDHFTQLGPISRDAVQEHPLKMHDPVHHAARRVGRAWAAASHAHAGLTQRREQAP